MRVVGVEGTPPAIAALHADDPFCRPFDSGPMPFAIKTVECQGDSGGIVDIGVMGVLILEGPPAGPQAWAPHRPIADHLPHLFCRKPVERPPNRGFWPRVG